MGANFGYTLSDGVSFQGVPGPRWETSTTESSPKTAASWGLQLSYHVNENSEVGFLFDKQSSSLDVVGTTTRPIGDMSLENYHTVISLL